MDIIKAINTRRSVRKYTSEMVKKETIDQLINSAIQAPSGMNKQPWAFSVIQDKKLLNSISDKTKKYLLSIIDKNPDIEKYRNAFMNPDFDIFYNTSTLLTIYSKPGLQSDWDCCLAAQNVMLTANALGLGTCWIGFAQVFLNTEEMKKELNIPSEYTVVAPLIIGYPENENKTIKKNAPDILFWK